MQRHARVKRLLTVTVAALILTSAFADAAQANLGLPGSQGAPLAPVSSVVSEVQATVAGTLDATTASTNTTVGDAAGTVTQASSTLDATLTETVGGVQSTLDTTVPGTVEQVQTTVDTLVVETVPPVAETVRQVAGDRGGPELRPAVPLASSDGGAATSTTSPAPPALIGASSSQSPAVAARTESAPSRAHVTGIPPTMHADARSAASRRDRAVKGAGLARSPDRAVATPAYAETVRQDGARGSAPRIPERRGPAVPIGPLSALMEGSGGGGQLVTWALLALIALVLTGAVGPRLRPVADLLHPPDVLFRLERPG